jgi:hypothetical protein
MLVICLHTKFYIHIAEMVHFVSLSKKQHHIICKLYKKKRFQSLIFFEDIRTLHEVPLVSPHLTTSSCMRDHVCFYLFVCYLTTLSASRLYSADDRTIKECGAVGRVRGNRSTREKTSPNANSSTTNPT